MASWRNRPSRPKGVGRPATGFARGQKAVVAEPRGQEDGPPARHFKGVVAEPRGDGRWASGPSF